MKTCEEGIKLIKAFEGLELFAYKHDGDRWTVGYGSTYWQDGTPVKEGDKIKDGKEAHELLMTTLVKYEEQVSGVLKVELSPFKFSSLVSFTYNLGIGNLKDSTLLKLVNKQEFSEASLEFGKWRLFNKKISEGLVRRRASEAVLFDRGLLDFNADENYPQYVYKD